MPKVGLLEGVMCFVVVLVIGVITIGGLKCLCVISDWWSDRQKRKDSDYVADRLAALESVPCDRGDSCALAAEESIASSLLLDVLQGRSTHNLETAWYGGWEACMEWFDKGCPPCPEDP